MHAKATRERKKAYLEGMEEVSGVGERERVEAGCDRDEDVSRRGG